MGATSVLRLDPRLSPHLSSEGRLPACYRIGCASPIFTCSEDLMTIGTVERALQLAPECRTLEEVRAKLVREGHSNIDAHLQGSLRRDLKRLLKSRT
jgi:hypothetical protein